MKKILLIMLLIFNMPSYAKKIENTIPEIYEVYDLTSNKVLTSKSESKVHSIASLTKLMTAHVFFKYYEGNINDCVTKINENDNDTIKNTHTRIMKNQSISCHSLLQIMLLVSDNYAASAIARSLPNISKENFYLLMNKEAKYIGMHDTFYKDATGLSFENKSTATDLIKLIKIIIKNEKIKELSSTYGIKLQQGEKSIVLKNSNKLIRENIYSAQLSKTGYISESGYNLIFVPKDECDNKKIAIVIMNSKSSIQRAQFAEKLLTEYKCQKN